MRRLIGFVVISLLGAAVPAAVLVLALRETTVNPAILIAAIVGPELLILPFVAVRIRNADRNRRLRNPVRGEATVVSVSAPSCEASRALCSLVLVVRAPGVAPTTVQHSCNAATKKWPDPGMTLPVTVDRDDPTRLRIEWDEVPTSHQVGIEMAERLATAMRAGTAAGAGDAWLGGTPLAGSTGTVTGAPQTFQTNTISVNGRTVDARENPALRAEILGMIRDGLDDPGRLQPDLAATLQRHGISFDGPGGDARDPAGGPAGDPAERLRRLEVLRGQGLIDDREYQAQRTRILGEL